MDLCPERGAVVGIDHGQVAHNDVYSAAVLGPRIVERLLWPAGLSAELPVSVDDRGHALVLDGSAARLH